MSTPTEQDELIRDVKSLTQGATAGDQSLEDILAEYGAPSAKRSKSEKKAPPPVEEIPLEEELPDNVIPFPTKEEKPAPILHDELEADPLGALFGAEVPQRKEKKDPLSNLFTKNEIPAKKEPSDPLGTLFVSKKPEPETEPEPAEEEPEDDSGMFSNLLNSIDRRAQRMYEAEDSLDPDEVRRLEEFIPGTDYEDEEDDEDNVPFFQRLRWETPPPPDTPPRTLAAQFHKGLFSLRLRGVLVFLFAILSFVPMILPLFSLTLPPVVTADPRYLLWGYAGVLGFGMLLSIDLLWKGLWRGLRLKIGFDTLLALCAAVNLGDCIYLSFHLEITRTPYAPITLIALWLLLHGGYHKRMSQHLSCRSAAAAKTPYLVTLDEKKWNARDTYCKWSGAPVGFGSQMQMDDGGQKFFSKMAPLLLAGCIAAIVPTFGQWELTLWTASATLTAGCALGAPLCYGRTAHKLEQRLSQSGATLAGWSGAKESKKGSRVLLTDTDLFPTGSISMKQPRYFKGHSDAKVVAYTASLLNSTNCGLTPLFSNYLRSYGGLPRKVERPLFHEGGGVSGHVWHDDVLVGSASFMNLMGVPLQAGLHVNQTVFCAINGELAGMFPLNYSLPDTITPAVYTLLGEDIAPILASRDFNLIPATLSGRFHLPAEEMDFPVIERRRELSDDDSPHSDILTAVLCREGLLPFSEAVVAAKRLRIATRSGGLVCFIGSALGIALTAYLTSVEAYSSAEPLNLLVFLLLWFAPVWLITEWSHRF